MKNQKLNCQQLLIPTTLFIIFSCIHQVAFTQDYSLNNSLKIGFENPSKFQLSYERALTTFSSFAIGIQGYKHSQSLTSGKKYMLITTSAKERILAQGYNLIGEYRFYFYSQQQSLNGLYLAPHLFWGKHQLIYQKAEPDGFLAQARESLTNQGFGTKLGYQLKWQNYVLDLSLNLSRSYVVEDLEGIRSIDGELEAFDEDIDGWETTFNIGFGVTF